MLKHKPRYQKKYNKTKVKGALDVKSSNLRFIIVRCVVDLRYFKLLIPLDQII